MRQKKQMATIGSASAAGRSHPSSTVLLVEDEFLIRELASEYLEDAGFEVTVARDAREALDILKQGEAFDLLFTDIRMPGGMDGKELADIARGMMDGLKVIYATGYLNSTDPLSDAERLIQKPYNMGTLRETLGQLGFAEG